MIPNFLFIGPDKTGSSWLYEVLRAHPQCFVPVAKDIYFFDRHYDRGIQWYLSFFSSAHENVKAIGELSHDYLFSGTVAERISRDLPKVKLLTCLRDPVERTFSQYLFLVRSGWAHGNIEQALEEYPMLVENSLYAKYLEKYFRLFRKEQIKVLFFDDLQKDPTAFAHSIFDFLGVDFVDHINYSKKVLAAGKSRSPVLSKALHACADIARSLGLVNLVGVAKRSALTRLLYKDYGNDEKPVCPPAVRERLLETFRPDIERLEKMLSIDLANWKR